jgi:DNA repair protein RecN (Recombination protein N)
MFELAAGHAAFALLGANGIPAGSGEPLILRRAVSGDGRTRAFINDQPVGVALAREVGAALIEVHGQTDDRGLFDIATHRILLDSFAGETARAVEVSRAYGAYAEAVKRRDELIRTRDSAKVEREFLAYAVKELEQLGPEPGEESRLAGERAFLMNASRIAEDVYAAAQFVSGDGGAELSLASALRRLSRMNPEGRQAAAAAESALEAALAHVEEARRELDAVAARLDAEPGKLESVEERLFAIRAAARKYNVPPDRLAELQSDFEAKLSLIDSGDGGIAAAEAEVKRMRATFVAVASQLSEARKIAAVRLERAVAQELEPLKMGHARFRVSLVPLSEDEANAGGRERVAFEVATLEGAEFGTLSKIASGGELSRFALALKVALAEASPPAILVFDEIDRGVGGAVADAVGERLQRLAKTTQVLLVTHSPQVAARGAAHFRILRRGDATEVVRLSDEERVEEIARMLSGAAVTDEARAAARRLMAEAQCAGGRPATARKRARA